MRAFESKKSETAPTSKKAKKKEKKEKKQDKAPKEEPAEVEVAAPFAGPSSRAHQEWARDFELYKIFFCCCFRFLQNDNSRPYGLAICSK